MQEIDVVSTRNSIRKLLQFLAKSKDEYFDVHADLAYPAREGTSVLVLTRVEVYGISAGYGHSFEDLITRPEPLMNGFHRIVGYNIGDLRCLLRCEVDCCEEDREAAMNDLADRMEEASVASESEWTRYSCDSDIKHRKGGRAVPHATFMEIKSKNSRFRHEFSWGSTNEQMQLALVDKLVVGWHNRGLVEAVEQFSLEEVEAKAGETVEWGKLQALLCRVRELAIVHGPLTLHFDGIPGGPLLVLRRQLDSPSRVHPDFARPGPE